ncbi:hypothetical protein C2E21_6948 [Chlorella sorokiniana]|uniref:Uncharacterized protein n=1 Tax=Chlorella sorokiniana TaxID=3076 RepID=A0A2P6TJC3_CHLSO|nr:hypothetical protein C2E21_6948 [Chlorella sorokiniana]|eukprot:PRW39348.1 hypothetical protein C2E21_6948 [Chlorella sorokiniana]
MSLVRLKAQQICDRNENTSTKRFKTGNGSAVPCPGQVVEAALQNERNTIAVPVKGRVVAVFGEEQVEAVKAAREFNKEHTDGAPGALALRRIPPFVLVRTLRELQELGRQHKLQPLERPVEACLQVLLRNGLPLCDFCKNVLYASWLPAERAGGLQPGRCVWVVGHSGRGAATLADAGSSKAGSVFSACLLGAGLLPSDTRLIFTNVVPSSNEEVERQYEEAAEQMEAEEAEDEAAAPARQLEARKAHVRMLAEAYAAGLPLPAEQPQLLGPQPLAQPLTAELPEQFGQQPLAQPLPLVQPRPPLPPGGGPDPVLKDELDEQAALLYQMIYMTTAGICKQVVEAVVVASPAAVPVMCGVQPSDDQLLGLAPAPPLRPELISCLPPYIIIIIIIILYPTCCCSRYFVDEVAVERVLANMPPGMLLPGGKFQARGVLAAVQHTVSLERCVQAACEAARALGQQPPPLEEAYAGVMRRLQAEVSPHLHCMALPGGFRGDLPGLVRRAMDMAAVLGTEFELGEERDQRHAKHCKLSAEPPPANKFTRALITQRDAAEAAFMAPRLAQERQLARSAVVPAAHFPLQAVGAGPENALMVAGRGDTNPLHIRVGDRLISHKPKPGGQLKTHKVVGVEAYLMRGTIRIRQGYKVEGAKSDGSPGSFNLLLTPATGIVLGYNTTSTATAASLERTVLARSAEQARVRRREQKMKVVLCLEGSYPDVEPDWIHKLLLQARECCAQVYRRRGLNPDDYLPSVEALLSLTLQQLGYLLGAVLGDGLSRDGSMIYSASDLAGGVLRVYCRLLLLLRLTPVASHDEGTSIRVRGSTASGARCCEQSWVLGEDGEAVVDAQGQRVRPQANDWDVNILVQFLVLVGAIDGNSRTLQQRVLSRLLMQPVRFLLPLLGGAVDTDGWYNQVAHAILFGQGRLCGKDTQVLTISRSALRCGVGGLVTVSSGSYHVRMRGARLPELRACIKVPHKQPPAEVNRTKYMRAGLGPTYQKTDPHLRRFCVEEEQGLQLCVRIRLAGGPQLLAARGAAV